jgi:hypothetical protein
MSKKQIIGIGVAVLLIGIYLGIKMYVSNVAEKRVNEAIAKAADFVDIDYKKVSVDLLGMYVRISDILVSTADAKEKIKINEITIHDIDDKSDIPSFLSISCDGIELNIKDLGENAKGLKSLGYNDKMMINLTADYTYDKDKNELDIKKIKIGADEAGEISVSLRLGNINLEPEKIVVLFFTFPQVIFYEAKIKYKDDSLAERLMKLGAQTEQTNIKDFKKSLLQKLEKEFEKEKDDLAKKALVEIKEFLENPEEFSILASPSQPYPLYRIMRVEDPKDVINLLNIQIKS